MQAIEDMFGPGGPLARHLPGFVPRKSQRRMAGAVAAALEARRPLLVEAGTGTGKTFAYLVPALFAGLRVLVSTGTRTLQDQLFSKDVPLVAGAIGTPAKVALAEDGRQITGFVTSQAAESLALRDAQGVEHRVEKSAIEEVTKLPTSVMPEGLVADLTVAQFASLLDFIEAMKQK